MRPVTFVSDYGYEDEFAGVCRAVIERVAPGTPVIDITHGIPPHDVTRGAFALAPTAWRSPSTAVVRTRPSGSSAASR